MKKKALIVDDSKLARFVLKEMLREYGLQADTSESAEEALGYLCTQRPDVIFMDHTMPGMDGLKAVEAIKNDPQTAAIPIMMYTSKEGAMYVSQARALGAVGVLPKQLKSVQLGKVLQQLGLMAGGDEAAAGPRSGRWNDTLTPSPGQPEKKPAKPAEPPAITGLAAAAEPAASSAGPESKLDLLEDLAHEAEHSAEITWLRPLLRDLLEEQRQQIRGDLRRALVPGDVHGDERENGAIYMPPPPRPANTWALPAFILAVPLALFAYVLNGNTDVIAALQLENQRLQSLALQQDQKPAAGRLEAGAVTTTAGARAAANPDLLEAMTWANNHRNTVPYTDVPLGDTALEILSRLVPALNAAEVAGTLVLITHTAEFCVVEDPAGELALAAENLPFAECTLNEQNLGESIEFSNYLASVHSSAGPDIRVRVENRGNLEPAVPYPQPQSLVNAGQWNRVAQENNRIEIAFERQSKGIALN